MADVNERWAFSVRTRSDTVSVRIVVPSESVHKPEEPIDLKGHEAREAFQLFAQGYVDGALERARDRRMAKGREAIEKAAAGGAKMLAISASPQELYNAAYSDGWNECQDQLNDAYKSAAERDDALIALEKKCNEWLMLVSRAHDRLGYPSHDNVKGAEKDIDQVLRGLRVAVEHDNEDDAVDAEGADEDWTDEEMEKRIEAKLALWVWRFSRGLRPHSREGLLAHEALEARKKLAVLLRADRTVNAALERFAVILEASGPPPLRDVVEMVVVIKNRFEEEKVDGAID